MAKGLNLDIGANTREFQKGVKDVAEALDQVADSLDDVAREGDQSAEKLERSFSESEKDISKSAKKIGDELGDQTKRGAKDAEKQFDALAKDGDTSAERLEKSFSEAQRDISASSKKIGDDLGSSSKRGAAEASGNMRELSEEAKANLAETLSSFDGTVEGTIAGIQGTLGGVTAGLTGVVPIIAAAAGAAGLGLIATAFEQGGEQAQKVREQIAELAAEFIETGRVGETSVDYIVDKLKELATSSEEGATNLADIQRQAQGAASGFEKIAQAYAGNQEGLEELIRTEEKRLDILKKADEEAYIRASDQLNFDHSKVTNQQKIIDGLKEQKKIAEEAALAEAAYAASGAAELEAKAARIETINDAYDEAASGAEDFINAETGIFDTAAYIASMIAREEALKNYQDTLAKTSLTPEAKAFIDSQGADAAAAFLSGYVAATPEQQAELNRIWTEAAHQNSGTYRDKVQGDFTGGAHIRGPAVDLQLPDTNAVVNGLQSNLNGRVLRVRAVAVDRNGREVD